MENVKDRMRRLFERLNDRLDDINDELRRDGLIGLAKGEIKLLGQISLLVQDQVSAILSLAYTADLDAWLSLQHVAKAEFNKLLTEEGLFYDEDSEKIWLPKEAEFVSLFSFTHIDVSVVDAESALVSKAVKAASKNRQLIREAIASGQFPNLAERIVGHGGDLENFL